MLIRSETKILADDISRASKLKVIVKQGVGVDNIDLSAAKARGVMVCNTPGINSESVAELTLTLALAVSRRVCEMDRAIRAGARIVRSQMLGRSLFRKMVGVVDGRSIRGRAVGLSESDHDAACWRIDGREPESQWDCCR